MSALHATPEEAVTALSGVTQVRALPAGGQAAVFRVAHHLYGECVVKVYTAEGEPRVAAEVDFLRDVHHDGIMSILEHGFVQVAGGTRPFTIMPFVDGGSLQERIDSNDYLIEDEARTLVRGVADAVTVLWNARKVHRDIKPQNILLPPGGSPVLIDFGIVRHLDMSTMTVPGGAPGTRGYKSPEQSAGVRNLTYKSDIFSLGITVYYGVSGVHPFQGRQELIDAGMHPPALASVVACSPALSSLVDKTMEYRAILRVSLPELYSGLN